MYNSSIRVRFAPSPSGFMHLGNVRAALLNFLFAQQKNGTFILRIEDTDASRNVDPMGINIIEDLKWLNLNYQEGPVISGPYEPYYQSMRQDIYKKYLEKFIEKKLVYRCFCTPEELEKKRQRQLALKTPPRYDRACAILTDENLTQNLENQVPFIWRFKLDHTQTVKFFDLAHKEMSFELKHFSDVPLTRQDGSFTFIFANFVDDVEMKISHVFRGEDHLTNTAAQVALYESLGAQLPIFWHLPIIGNKEGKKLSKRDFGFSLTDLKNAGFLPQAICNYLAIIGASFAQEIMPMDDIIKNFNFENLSSTGQIKYDLEKLKWVNHQHIIKLDLLTLTSLCRPFLEQHFEQIKNMTDGSLSGIIKFIQPELVTLDQSVELLKFYFEAVKVDPTEFESFGKTNYKEFFVEALNKVEALTSPEEIAQTIQKLAKEKQLSIKEVFTLVRLALTGKPQGLSIKDLITLLGVKESLRRLMVLVS